MATWFPVGQQRKVKTYGKHFSVKLTGILNYETGAVHIQESFQFDAEVFCKFLKEVLALYPKGSIVMVLDNSRVHHAVLLEPFLVAHPRLRFLFLPPYSPSPELNNIEGL